DSITYGSTAKALTCTLHMLGGGTLSMERFIAGLVKDFEAGKISRRQFGEAVAIAAVVYGYGNAAKAAPAKGLKMLGVNHISYSCDDYAKARDWYSSNL